MPIWQLNVFQCECCLRFEVDEKEVEMYSDPVVTPPKGQHWNIGVVEGEEKMLCDKCFFSLKKRGYVSCQ